MEERDDGLDASCYHTRNQIIVVRYALLVHWAVAEWEESWPGPESTNHFL
jgi:hypothetical protein